MKPYDFMHFLKESFLKKHGVMLSKLTNLLKNLFSIIKITLKLPHLLKSKYFDNNHAIFMYKCIYALP